MEDEFVRHNQNASSSGRLALRPGYGTRGKPILLRSNFFEVFVRDSAVYYIYKIGIKPEKPPKRHLKEIFGKIMKSPRVVQADGSSDGAAELVLLKQLSNLEDMNIGCDQNGNADHGARRKAIIHPGIRAWLTLAL